MQTKDTPESRALAAVIARNANSATGLNLARRACWRGGAAGLCLLGVGGLLAGAGIGAQKSEEGYASIIGNREIAERAAQTTAAMLANERDEFHAMLGELVAKLAATKLQGTMTGEVGLKDGGLVGLKTGQLVGVADGQQVTLAKGGTVALPPDTTIHLDPNATVRAVGEQPDAPRRAPKLLRQASAPAPKACQIAQP